MKTIPEGDYYSCTDEEYLTHTSPEEAVADYLEGWDGDCPFPVEVFVYKRTPVDAATTAKGLAARAAQDAVEFWDINYGGPDGEMRVSMAEEEDLCRKLQAVLEPFLAERTPWTCDRIAAVTLEEIDVRELLREEVSP